MPGSKATKAVKRPAIVKADSSSSSLSGMEQYVPPFQSFVRQTPNVGERRALPPPPSVPRRASSTSPPRSRSRTPSSQSVRRTSSVYSRTVSGWGTNEIRWQHPDYSNEPLPPLPILQPLAYSASTPQLVEKLPTPPLLQPRKYSPLIASPSPSRAGTPQPPPEQKQLSLSNGKSQQTHVRMVSLAKAKAAVHSPGAIHLLPEELRAQTSGRSRSHEPVQMRIASYDIFAGKTPPELPEPPTLVDNQGRQRSFYPSKDTTSPTQGYFPPNREYSPGFRSATGHDIEDFAYKYSSKKEGKPTGHQYDTDDSDVSRGRTKDRVPRKIKNEYGSGLNNDPYRQPPKNSAHHVNDSEENIGMQMKMVPQPLFQNKPLAHFPGSVGRHDSNKSVSPYHLSIHEGSDNGSRRRSSENPFQLSHSVASDSSHMRTSTSGSIPISPPTSIDPVSRHSSERVVERTEIPENTERPKRKVKNPRVSAYYPHVAPRKGVKRKKNRNNLPTPPMPLLSADIIAQRDQTRFENSPDITTAAGDEGKPLTGSERFRKYVDLLTKPREASEQRTQEPLNAATVSPESPHLLPSPVKSDPPNVHLGWSAVAKETFDKAHSPPSSPRKPPPHAGGSLFTHIAAPARPLDESKAALKEPETPRRKSSIFGSFLDSWKENKAEKRREELKKIIRVVPQTEMSTGGNFARRANAFGSV